jgi:hypothetical protein
MPHNSPSHATPIILLIRFVLCARRPWTPTSTILILSFVVNRNAQTLIVASAFSLRRLTPFITSRSIARPIIVTFPPPTSTPRDSLTYDFYSLRITLRRAPAESLKQALQDPRRYLNRSPRPPPQVVFDRRPCSSPTTPRRLSPVPAASPSRLVSPSFKFPSPPLQYCSIHCNVPHRDCGHRLWSHPNFSFL